MKQEIPVADVGATPAASTIMPGSQLTTWQLSAGPAPYGGEPDFDGTGKACGDNRQTTTGASPGYVGSLNSVNNKRKRQFVRTANGCLISSRQPW